MIYTMEKIKSTLLEMQYALSLVSFRVGATTLLLFLPLVALNISSVYVVWHAYVLSLLILLLTIPYSTKRKLTSTLLFTSPYVIYLQLVNLDTVQILMSMIGIIFFCSWHIYFIVRIVREFTKNERGAVSDRSIWSIARSVLSGRNDYDLNIDNDAREEIVRIIQKRKGDSCTSNDMLYVLKTTLEYKNSKNISLREFHQFVDNSNLTFQKKNFFRFFR